MNPVKIVISTIELVSAVFVFILLVGQFIDNEKERSLKRIRMLLGLTILWLLSDALSYILEKPETPHWILYALNMISYVMCPGFATMFAFYADSYVREKGSVSKWWFTAPALVELLGFSVYIISFVRGDLGTFDGNVFISTDKVPPVAMGLYIAFLIYAPVVCFCLYKKIGIKPGILVSIYMLPTLVAIIVLTATGMDYTVIASALSATLLCSVLERDVTKKKIRNSMLAENNDRILALQDDFESLYDVDLFTFDYDSYVKGETYSEHIHPKLVNNKDFFKDTLQNISLVGHPEDIPEFRRIMNVDFIRKALKESDYFEHYYRLIIDEEPRWLRLRMVYKNKDKSHLIVGVFNAEELMHQKDQEEKFRRQLVENMISDDALFLIDLEKDTRTTLRNETPDQKDYSDANPFTYSIEQYIQNAVIEYDRKKVREMTTFEYMKKRLNEVSEYKFRYRETSQGTQRFYEMRFAKFTNNQVLMSVAEKDEEILDGLIFDNIKEDYFAMFAIDSDEGFARVMKNDPEGLGVKPGDVIPYQDLVLRLSNVFRESDPQTADYFAKLSDTKYLKQKFAAQNKSSYVFKSALQNSSKWVTTNEFVLTRHNPSNDPGFIAIGFSLLDNEASENAILQQRLADDMNVIGGLAGEYEALFYVNMDEATFKIYSISPQFASAAKNFLNGKFNGPDIIKEYGTSAFVHPDDHDQFKDFSVDFVREKLANSKKFSMRFRRKVGNDYSWFEMDILKNENIDERANIVIIGFEECAEEVRREQALRKSFSVLNKDIISFEAVQELLSVMGEYYGGRRTYVCEILKTKNYLATTYEWMAENSGMISLKHNEIPLDNVGPWLKALSNGDAVLINAKDLHKSTEEANVVLKENGVKHLMLAPMVNNGELVGFLGIDNPTKSLKELGTLETVATIAYSEILKRKEGDEEHVTLEKVTDSFVSVYFADLSRDYAHNWKLSKDYRYTDEDSAVSKFSESFKDYVKFCIDPEEQEHVLEQISPKNILEQFKTKSIFSVDMKDVSKGKATNLVFDFIKVSEDGNQFVICSRDITETIAKEKEQKRVLQDALERADAANRSKTNFLFNMSHDIRTPMNAIQGFTDMAIKYIDNKEKALDCLKKTQQSGSMLLSLINSVLEVSRIESGNATLDLSPGDVYYSFANIELTMKELANLKDITLTFNFGEIKNKYVFCDIARCVRIFVNIISNAIKYTPSGGFVDVSCKQISDPVDGVAKYEYIIKDNGIGMSEEFQKHVFEQFSREKNSTVSGIQGTGLGMSVVKSFVDLMGGTIVCDSKLGEGTTFTVVLPFKLQEDEKYVDPITNKVISKNDNEKEEVKISLKNRKVLLVDDNALNREIAAEILGDEGMIVEPAFDGLMAVNTVKEKGADYYDFILMDIQMPIMNGYDATKEIRKLFPDAKLPIIALSANAFAEDKAASIDAGMNDHVAKPINVKELMTCLAKYLKD